MACLLNTPIDKTVFGEIEYVMKNRHISFKNQWHETITPHDPHYSKNVRVLSLDRSSYLA